MLVSLLNMEYLLTPDPSQYSQDFRRFSEAGDCSGSENKRSCCDSHLIFGAKLLRELLRDLGSSGLLAFRREENTTDT